MSPSALAARELELKLACDPDTLNRILRSPIVRDCAIGRMRSRNLHSVYFDTAEGYLRRQSMGLRLREQGHHWIQTFKRDRDSAGGLHDRDEIEHVVKARWPSFAPYDHTNIEPVFADLEVRQAIQPVFETTFRRRLIVLRHRDALIECAFDQGVIQANGRFQSLCELELELKSGAAIALFELAGRLCKAFPLRLEDRSKAERGYTLDADAAVKPEKASAVSLSNKHSVSDAFAGIAMACLRHLQRNERGVLEQDDPEFVHQARVALRRLRAALAVFRPLHRADPASPVESGLRDTARALGAARDWDVFCTEFLPALPAALVPDDLRVIIDERARAQRQHCNVSARTTLRDPGYVLMLLELMAALHSRPWDSYTGTPKPPALVEFARDSLNKRARKVQRLAKKIDWTQPGSLHALRIALKKLRYAMDFFAPLFSKRQVRGYSDPLTRLQDQLGKTNDCAAALMRLESLLHATDSSALHESLGALRGYLLSQSILSMSQSQRQWRKFSCATPFWE